MTKKTLSAIVLSGGVGLFLLAGSATAVFNAKKTQKATGADSVSVNLATSSEEIKKRAQEATEFRCQMAETRIDTAIKRYENNEQRNKNIHNKIKERLTTLINKLEAGGYDVSELKNDLKTLDEKLISLYQTYDKYIEELKASKSYACGKSQGEFLKQIKQARTQLKEVRMLYLEIRNLYQNEIRADLKALREEYHKEQTTSTTQEETTPQSET